MGKYADRYFQVHPWQVEETGFDPAYGPVAESVFSLGNEYMGLRGYFEEGYSGEGLQGSYINGVYEQRPVPKSGYKGMLDSSDFMVNTVDWVHTRLRCNGVPLDLAAVRAENFRRVLDLRTGVLTRAFTWRVDAASTLELRFERFLSMEQPELGGQRVEIRCLEGGANLELHAGLDFSTIHQSTGEKNYWTCADAAVSEDGCGITGHTVSTGQTVRADCRFRAENLTRTGGAADDAGKRTTLTYTAALRAGESCRLTRVAAVVFRKEGDAAPAAPDAARYDLLQAASAAWWERQWALSDIRVDGDPVNQQGIRFCIFQLHQTLHTAGRSAVIGAKGLTGEAYNGNTFWDSEVYCLPFYLFNNPAAAKNILLFRYETLPQARERARALDCAGAFYPIATIAGRECCDLWQHASLQLQPSTSVAYAVRLYVQLTGDKDFLYEKGIEMLAEVCRMLATRGDWDPVSGRYGYYGVMGPDEFQMMVNNNCYTNFMAKKSIEYTLEALAGLERERPDLYAVLADRIGLAPRELADWADKAAKMAIPYDPATLLFEQHDGYFRLPHLEVKDIPVEDFPLYSHWSYERIYRNDMLKQPDVLMFLLLYNSAFTPEQLAANYAYYEPRCIHESSLSPSVHSILAAQIGMDAAAYDLFGFATRMDLDNYNRNTGEGLHTTSIAGAWMNIVYGFGGLRCDGGQVSLAPTIPAGWDGYTFRLLLHGVTVSVEVSPEKVTLAADRPVTVPVYGCPVEIDGPVTIPTQSRRERHELGA